MGKEEYTRDYREDKEKKDYKYDLEDYKYDPAEEASLEDYRYDLEDEAPEKLEIKASADRLERAAVYEPVRPVWTEDSDDYKYDEYELDIEDYQYEWDDEDSYDYKYDVVDTIRPRAPGTTPVMRVCLVAEGCYPYVVGGVSSWIHSLIKSLPNVEFILLTIVANRSIRGKFVYELPENLTEVHEVYLEDVDWVRKRRHGRSRLKLSEKEYLALRSLILNQNVNWHVLFQMFHKREISLNNLLMGADFFHAVSDCYDLQYSQIAFSDFLWTMRSIYLPLFFVLKMRVPAADLYHCVATGYAGVLGSMAKDLHGSRILISEHGIYTREREEELIKAKWVTGVYKNIWIEQFRKMSQLAYNEADLVTSLYEHARELQVELGCPAEKTMVTPNGINTERLQDLPQKTEEDMQYINIGAVLRVTPIKDVKTMIQAFGFAKERQSRLKLWIMGPTDEDKDYAQECFDLVETMQIQDIIFTGRIDVRDYLGRMDITLLTSISEGQPLTILESYAAHRPVIATDVGNCRGLIFGEDDDFGPAGILTHIMNIEEISQAMLELASDAEKRRQMGENGYRRLMKKYKIEDMKAAYEKIYSDFAANAGLEWSKEEFHIDRGKYDGKSKTGRHAK